MNPEGFIGDDFLMKQELLGLTQELVSIRSVLNDGNTEISDYIEAWLKATGFNLPPKVFTIGS